MHAVKVTCVGRTFALANSSDSGGKRSRIRRSKEERKSMVEIFIKKYQNSNAGKFPSLSLTHREVGGSFYTVRELVREIIQENRVLGPAKFTSDELMNNEQLSDQYPLGSISTQPPSDLCFSSNENNVVSNNHHINGIELVNASSGEVNGKQQLIFDNGRYNNGIMLVKENDADKSSSSVNNEMQYIDAEISDKSKGESKGVEVIVQAPSSKVTSVAADAIVETSPLKISDKPMQGSDGRSDEMQYIDAESSDKSEGESEGVEVIVHSPGSKVTSVAADATVETSPIKICAKSMQGSDGRSDEMQYVDAEISHKLEEKSEGVEVIAHAPSSKVTSIATDVMVETFPMETSSKLMQGSDGRSDEAMGLTSTIEEQSSDSVDEKAVSNLVDSLAESLSCHTTSKSVMTSTVEDTDLQIDASSNGVSSLQTSHQNQVPKDEPKQAPNAAYTQNKNASSTSSKSLSQGAVVETKADMQDTHTTEEGKNSTLNRINLESWEGASKRPGRRDDNPWALIKSFISAFVKIWMQ